MAAVKCLRCAVGLVLGSWWLLGGQARAQEPSPYERYAAAGLEHWPRPDIKELWEDMYFPAHPPPKGKQQAYERLLAYSETRRAKLAELLRDFDQSLPVVVMIINWGQTHLFFNWVCGLRQFGLTDALQQSLVFTADQRTHKAVRQLVPTYFVQPDELKVADHAAKTFGDRTFGNMMMLKLGALYAVVNEMQRDVIYQDVDVAWNHNPTALFYQTPYRHTDVLISYDGNIRQPPFYGNAGFFFVRSTPRGRHFAKDWLHQFGTKRGNAVQGIMNQVLTHHYLVLGLSLEVLPTQVVPHPHDRLIRRGGDFGRELDGVSPLVIHAAWTENHWHKVRKLDSVKRWWFNSRSGCDLFQLHRDGYGSDLLDCMENISCDHYKSRPGV